MALDDEFETQGQFLFRYRGILPVFVMIIGIIAFLESILTGKWPPVYWLNIPFELFCLLITLCGLAVRCYCVGYSSRNTSGRNIKCQVAESINTTGLYSIVRHPLYLGNFLMSLGVSSLTRNPWFILFSIFIFWVYYERIMFAEEQFLKRKFGQTYKSWASRTPAFIPNFSLWTRPASTFNCKKVVRNEKAGILAVAVTFLIFAQIEEFITNNQFVLHERFWYYLFVLSLISYTIIKLGIKYTSLLEYR